MEILFHVFDLPSIDNFSKNQGNRKSFLLMIKNSVQNLAKILFFFMKGQKLSQKFQL